MASTTFEPSLRDQVFEICENLYRNSEKVTRERVRNVLGRGSFTHISPLVAEWNRLKKEQTTKSTIDTESEIIPLEHKKVQENFDSIGDNGAEESISENEEPEINEYLDFTNLVNDDSQSQIIPVQESGIEQPAEQLNPTETSDDFLADDDMEIVVRGGAEKAASLLIAQEAIASHYFQNPNELPEDLKERLKGMRGNFTKARSQAQVTAYDPNRMISLAMSKVKEEAQKLTAG
jgi:hypothetical protein